MVAPGSRSVGLVLLIEYERGATYRVLQRRALMSQPLNASTPKFSCSVELSTSIICVCLKGKAYVSVVCAEKGPDSESQAWDEMQERASAGKSDGSNGRRWFRKVYQKAEWGEWGEGK